MIALALLVFACKSSTTGGKPPGEVGSAAPAQGSAHDAAPAPTPTLREADVRAMIGAWVTAQNTGNFAAYEQVYAHKLEGVKRARGRT